MFNMAHNKKSLMEIEISPIAPNTASVAVTVNGPWDEEKELRFPVTIASPLITNYVFKELGIVPKQKEKGEMIERIEVAKKYCSEVSFELSLTGIKGKIKWLPKMITKYYSEKT
jgi:hypothetical protein